MIKSIDDALWLSQIYEVCVVELGQAFVLFFFSIMISLIDNTLDDWGLQKMSLDRQTLVFGSTENCDMDIDPKESDNFERNEHHKQMRRMNSLIAMEVVGKLTESRKAMALLCLVHFN
ncbi:hypothetical protein UlMin_012249, partial [Ulmus minor]